MNKEKTTNEIEEFLKMLNSGEDGYALIDKAVKDLVSWQKGDTFFYSSLYSLIAKADESNMARLKKAFPEYIIAFSSWRLYSDHFKV